LEQVSAFNIVNHVSPGACPNGVGESMALALLKSIRLG